MIVTAKNISSESKNIGAKTKHLKELMDTRYNVPDFVAIPSDTVVSCEKNTSLLHECCENIRAIFPRKLYAVRSSALIEDDSHSSMAGQFHTEIAVTPDALEDAVYRVIDDAKNILTDLNLFSIIVQEYIEVKFSGVCFTRNPNGGREMVVEYHKGIGEKLVSGEITPEQQSFYWNNKETICGHSAELFERIETQYDFPQDVEWGTKGKTLYILQTRPITTISEQQYTEIKLLETTFEGQKHYNLEKTEISEIAPRPTPFTLSLLEKIYSEEGPVMRVYKKHKIHYISKPFLAVIGNELYIDHNLETKTLLPSYSYDRSSKGPRLTTFRGAWATMRNIFRIMFLRENPALIVKLQSLIGAKPTTEQFSENLKSFLDVYETVFEVNLFAARYLKKLEIMLKKENIMIGDLLGTKRGFFGENMTSMNTEGLGKIFGNTLEISDIDAFYTSNPSETTSKNTQQWWNALPSWKQKLYQPHIQKALSYQHYRECARILMLKYLNLLRDSLYAIFPDEKENSYFCTITEIEENKYDLHVCSERKSLYEKYLSYQLPNMLSSDIISGSAVSTGISPGEIRGTIVTEETIGESSRPRILWTKILSPSLTKYFPLIDGIITEKGGLLSHLAIIAREKNLPVVVAGNNNDLAVGQVREINGSTGTIQ